MLKILKAGMSMMAHTISTNWTFDTGEKLSQMVFKKFIGIQCGDTAGGRVSVTLLGPLWLLMLT